MLTNSVDYLKADGSKLEDRDIGLFSGATILGDGRVALILDVAQLVKSALERSAERAHPF